MEAKPLHRVIRLRELPAYVGLRRTQLETLIARGEFPRPIKLSVRGKAWLESEIIGWQQRKIAERDRKPKR